MAEVTVQRNDLFIYLFLYLKLREGLILRLKLGISM